MVDGHEADERFSLVEHPMSARALAAPLHRHTNEDEYSFVIEGRMGALLGGEHVEAGPGDLVHKPRGEWHTFWNAGDEPCRILEIISPGRLRTLLRGACRSRRRRAGRYRNNWAPCASGSHWRWIRKRARTRAALQPSLPGRTTRAPLASGVRLSGAQQFPVPLGDDFNCAIGHLDGGLIVDRVRRRRSPGGPDFCVGQRVLRGSLVIQVRKQREVDQPQRSVVGGG